MYHYSVRSVNDLIFEEIYDDPSLQEAYERGYKAAYEKIDTQVDDAYEAGLEDARDECEADAQDDIKELEQVAEEIANRRLMYVEGCVDLMILWGQNHGVRGTVYDVLEYVEKHDRVLYRLFVGVLTERDSILRERKDV